jgi:hypothetical protein
MKSIELDWSLYLCYMSELCERISSLPELDVCDKAPAAFPNGYMQPVELSTLQLWYVATQGVILTWLKPFRDAESL